MALILIPFISLAEDKLSDFDKHLLSEAKKYTQVTKGKKVSDALQKRMQNESDDINEKTDEKPAK